MSKDSQINGLQVSLIAANKYIEALEDFVNESDRMLAIKAGDLRVAWRKAKCRYAFLKLEEETEGEES